MPASTSESSAVGSGRASGPRGAWLLLPVLVGAYLVFQLGVGGLTGSVLAQFAYLLGPLLAAGATFGAWRSSAPTSDERRFWLLLCLALTFLFASEAYFSAFQVLEDPSGPAFESLYQVLNALSAAFFVAFSLSVVQLRRYDPIVRLRVLADIVVLSILAYALIYVALVRFVVLNEAVATGEAFVMGAYAFLGLTMLSVAVSMLAAGWGRAYRWELLVPAALFSFGVGLALWPVWVLSQQGQDSSVQELLSECLYLAGTCVLVVAVAYRRAAPISEWCPLPIGVTDEDVGLAPVLAVASAVTAAIAVLGGLALAAPIGSLDRVFFFAATLLASAAVVVRTAATRVEYGRLRTKAMTDPISGARNHRWLQARLASLSASARTGGAPLAVVMLDLDRFSAVNTRLGYPEGDRLLAEVALALSKVAREADVCRVSGDEFAVLFRESDPERAYATACRLCEAIRSVAAGGESLTASVGLALCPRDAQRGDDTLRAADGAQTWAKFHGKDRVVRFRADLVHALDTEERLRLSERAMQLDVAHGIASAAEMRDSRHLYHSRNVAALVVLVGESLGLEPEHVQRIESAALLHDIGKIAIPDAAIASPRTASAERAFEEHALIGERLLGLLGLDDLGRWVRSHHECWDGSGYPDGLAGEDIPYEARLITLCNTYDSLVSGAVGRPPLSRAAALQEIDQGIGVSFDPRLAERFIAMVGATPLLGWTGGPCRPAVVER